MNRNLGMPRSSFLFPWLLLSFGCTCHSQAAEITVKPGIGALAAAVEGAKAGDVLTVPAGVWQERLIISKPLTLRGLPRAVMDGTEPFSAEWTQEGNSGVYVTSLKKRPCGLLVDGKFIAELRLNRAEKKGDWHWRTLLEKGPPLSGFDQIRALWVYHAKEQKLYARFENAADPQKLNLTLVQTTEPLIKVTQAQGVKIEGLEFRGASIAVLLEDGATECVVRECKISSYEDTGILLTEGAAQCLIEKCDITRGSLEEWSSNREQGRVNYEIWRIHKDVGNYDRVGIDLLRAGAGNRLLNNHLHRTFDGITLGDSSTESLDKPLADPNHGRDTEIAHNLIEDTRDSGIELGVGCINVNVHHNTLRHTHGGLRFKLPRIGPVFIHHNHLSNGSPFNIWFSMDSSPAEGYIYHNTFIGGDPAVMYLSFNGKPRDFATPKWHLLNNLVLGKDGFFEQGKNTPPPDFLASHNVCDHDNRPWPNDPAKDQGSVYNVSLKYDEATGRPKTGSAAVDTGIDLTTYWNGKPLPGCEPGYFKGKAPDAGADEVE